MQNKLDSKDVKIRKIQTASEYLPMIDAADADAEFYGAAAENDEDIYAVYCQDEVVGLSYIIEDIEGFLFVYIFPKYRGHGYGRAAVRLSERQIDSSKLESLTTCCDVNDETARNYPVWRSKLPGRAKGWAEDLFSFWSTGFWKKGAASPTCTVWLGIKPAICMSRLGSGKRLAMSTRRSG